MEPANSESSLAQTRLQLLLLSATVAIGHLLATYTLLTVNNPFNFNNNFHLIGFLSFLSFMLQLLILLLLSRLLHHHARRFWSSTFVLHDPFTGMSTFIVLLVILFFTILSPLVYFLLINDFMLGEIKPVLLGLTGLGLSIVSFSYWPWIAGYVKREITVNWWSLANKLILLVVYLFIFIILVNFLTGIIPAEIKPAQQPFLSL